MKRRAAPLMRAARADTLFTGVLGNTEIESSSSPNSSARRTWRPRHAACESAKNNHPHIITLLCALTSHYSHILASTHWRTCNTVAAFTVLWLAEGMRPRIASTSSSSSGGLAQPPGNHPDVSAQPQSQRHKLRNGGQRQLAMSWRSKTTALDVFHRLPKTETAVAPSKCTLPINTDREADVALRRGRVAYPLGQQTVPHMHRVSTARQARHAPRGQQ